MSTPKKLLACAKCYKLHRKCTGETRPCDYCKERKLECIENPDRKKRGRPKGSKNKFKSTPQQIPNDNNTSSGITNLEIQNIIEITRKRSINNINNNNNNINNPYNSQYPSVEQDPRIYMDYQKRQKILAQQQNENFSQQMQYMQQSQYIQQQPSQQNYIPNNTPTYQYANEEYYNQQQNISSNQHYLPRKNSKPNLIHHNIIPHQTENIYENHQHYSSPSSLNNTNEYQQNYPSYNDNQEMLPESINESEDLPSYNTSIPINYNQRRDLIIAPEKITSSSSLNNNNNNSPYNQHCIKCQTEMLNFKFCPHCGTPRERVQENNSLIPSISSKKLLTLAILEIVNENNSSFSKDDTESSLQTIWFVVKHPKITTNSSNGTVNLLGDFSLLSTVIKQVSPNWNSFLGYKTSESEKIPLSKFVPSNIEISPKSSSVWDSLSDQTTRNVTTNYSCQFVLCHKFGIIYGVDLQITTFACNGLPDTSFIVVKKHWNLMNVSEASQILNSPNLEFLSDRALSYDEEDDDEPSNINFELLRKAVDYKNIN